MSARESEIRSKHSLRSLAETVSSPVAFLMHNLRKWDETRDGLICWKLVLVIDYSFSLTEFPKQLH